MAAGQGAGDRKALNDLSVIFRDGIGVSPDREESVRWASVLGLMDNNASAAQSLQQLGYPRGFTGVVLPNGGSVASAITDDTPVVDRALVALLQAPPGSQQESPSLPLLFRCCLPANVPAPQQLPHHSHAVTSAQVANMFAVMPANSLVTVTADSMLLLWSSSPQPAFLGVCRAPGQYRIPNSSYKHALLPTGRRSL
jgi:hypothetical protein